jgi:hypothetical protein
MTKDMLYSGLMDVVKKKMTNSRRILMGLYYRLASGKDRFRHSD